MLKNYVKIALKVLLRQKFFTFVSLFGISITLTILFVVVAMLETVMTPGGSGSKLSRALYVDVIELEGENWNISSNPSYYLLSRHLRTLKTPSLVAIHSDARATNVYIGGRKVELQLKYTDSPFWQFVDFDFVEGMPYTDAQVTNADAVAVITDRTRNEVFGSAPAIGKYLETTSGTFRVIGVVPQDQMPGETIFADLWVPITQSTTTMSRTEPYGAEMGMVLPASSDDIDAIKKEFDERLDAVRADVAARFDSVTCPMLTQTEIVAGDLLGRSDGKPSLFIPVVIAVMILFMLLPAMNLINMTVSRIYERSSEIGVRKAFGASVSTLIWQFVIENVVLTLIGGALAVVAAQIVLNILNSSAVLPFAHFSLNLSVLVYSLIISLFFGVFSGVLPAYRMSRLHPVQALRGVTV